MKYGENERLMNVNECLGLRLAMYIHGLITLSNVRSNGMLLKILY